MNSTTIALNSYSSSIVFTKVTLCNSSVITCVGFHAVPVPTEIICHLYCVSVFCVVAICLFRSTFDDVITLLFHVC